MTKYPTENMKCGRRRIDEIPEVTLLEDWTWDVATELFYLHISISLEHGHPDIQRVTEWYVTVTGAYPFGPLNIYPSCKNGLTNTFPHQSINAFVEENNLWRTGKLCVSFISQSLGVHALEREPFTVEERLFWNIKRAVLWLQAAANGTLTKNGDFFELPEFPTDHLKTTFAFQEDSVSMMIWEDVIQYYGIAKVARKQLASNQSVAIVQSFHSIDSSETIYRPVWGTAIRAIEKTEDALWIRFKSIPTVNGWQAPTKLSDLKQICTSQDINLMEILKAFAPRSRDGRPHLLLIGFPIPEYIGEDPYEMAWQAIELPTLSFGQYTNQNFHSGKQHKPPRKKGSFRGFRPGEAGWWLNDKTSVLTDNLELNWLHSENWSSRTIKNRGRLTNKITSKRIAIIGLGSLGSSIAELLARTGNTHLTFIDRDRLTIGNLCRHTLTMQNVFQFKSKSIADRLATIDPNIITNYINEYLDLDENGALTPDLSSFDIIIDTTGDDQVLSLLSMNTRKRKIIFCSSSVGLGAKRMYINIQKTNQPNFNRFLDFVFPFFQKDQENCNLNELPRDGIGCWHPLFPARSDDMWLAACTTIKALESFVETTTEKEISMVYEVQNKEDLFTGFQLIEEQHE